MAFYRCGSWTSEVLACPRSHRKRDALHTVKLAPPGKEMSGPKVERSVWRRGGPEPGRNAGAAGSLCCCVAPPCREEHANHLISPRRASHPGLSGAGARPPPRGRAQVAEVSAASRAQSRNSGRSRKNGAGLIWAGAVPGAGLRASEEGRLPCGPGNDAPESIPESWAKTGARCSHGARAQCGPEERFAGLSWGRL